METKNYSIFDNIKNLDQNGNPYWSSRELCKALGYSTYQKFSDGILQKARNEASSLSTDFNHFSRQVKMVKIGSGALREIEDFHFSKEACLTIARKADSGKQQVVVAREYFKALNSCTTEIETHYEDCDDLNSVYIKKYTNRATKFYTDKIQELKERKLNGNISFVNDNSFRGIPSSHHIMYKMEPLESNDGMRKYEFLIEYKVTEPSVGIYYGCRGLIMKADDDDENEISKQP